MIAKILTCLAIDSEWSKKAIRSTIMLICLYFFCQQF